MVLSISLKDLFHSSGEGAVEAEEEYVCTAMLYHLVGPMAWNRVTPPLVPEARVSARKWWSGLPRMQCTPRGVPRGPQ